MDTSTNTITAQLAVNLTKAAEILAAHPDVPRPYITTTNDQVELNWYLAHDASAKEKAALVVQTIGGRWDKAPNDGTGWFTFTQVHDWGHLYIAVEREAICERVVVGTEKVTVPATEAVEAQPERVEEREVVEWRCLPLLADEAVAS